MSVWQGAWLIAVTGAPAEETGPRRENWKNGEGGDENTGGGRQKIYN